MNKMIISILLMVGLVGMTGTAAALTYVGGTVFDDNSVAVPLATVTAYSDETCLIPLNSGFTDSNGEYQFDISDLGEGKSVWVKAEEGGRIGITESTVTDTGLPQLDIVLADITLVPEFPTIALPIAAVLGLMFIISSRKKKE